MSSAMPAKAKEILAEDIAPGGARRAENAPVAARESLNDRVEVVDMIHDRRQGGAESICAAAPGGGGPAGVVRGVAIGWQWVRRGAK